MCLRCLFFSVADAPMQAGNTFASQIFLLVVPCCTVLSLSLVKGNKLRALPVPPAQLVAREGRYVKTSPKTFQGEMRKVNMTEMSRYLGEVIKTAEQ